MIRREITPDILSECKRRFDAESWANRRRFRQQGIHALAGPRDRPMPCVANVTNVSGHASPFRFIIWPGYHPDEAPQPPFFQAVVEGLTAFTAKLRHR